MHGGPHSGSDLVARPNHYTANTWSPANDEPRSTLDQNHQAVEPVDSTCEHRTCSDTNPDGARTGTRIIASRFLTIWPATSLWSTMSGAENHKSWMVLRQHSLIR